MGEMLEKSVWIKLSSRLSGILWSSPPRISAHSIWTTLLSPRWPGNRMGGQPSRRTVGPVEVQSDVRAARYVPADDSGEYWGFSSALLNDDSFVIRKSIIEEN